MDARSSSISSQRGRQQSQDGAASKSSTLSTVQDMDTLGEMEMDYAPEQNQVNQNNLSAQQNDQSVGDGRPPAINPSLANMMKGSSTSQPSDALTPTPGGQMFANHQDHMVNSSANASTLTPRPGQQARGLSPISKEGQRSSEESDPSLGAMGGQRPAPRLLNPQITNLNQEFNNLDFSPNGNNNSMLDLCISDPAKALFTEHGAVNSQQFPEFGFVNGAAVNTDDFAAALQAQRLAANREMLLGEEDRPFKCPVIGCEKSYKNANGLRYHEKVREPSRTRHKD